MNTNITQEDRILGEQEACFITNLGKTTLRERWNPSSPFFEERFPKPIKLGGRSIGYSALEIQAWIEMRKAARAEEVDIANNKL